MLNYIYGKITYIAKKYIIIESNFIGYKILMQETSNYEINKYFRIYIHKHIKFEKNVISEEMYGFEDPQTRNLFIDLISINGIGIVTASNILKNDFISLVSLIASNNYVSLKELNGINEKNAVLICSSLSNKYQHIINNNEIDTNGELSTVINNDLIFALKQLGYNKDDINYALSKCDNSLPLNELINYSIKIIAKYNQQTNNAQS